MRRIVSAVVLMLVSACGAGVAQVDGEESDRDELGTFRDDISHALQRLPSAEVALQNPDGIPALVRGDLGPAPTDLHLFTAGEKLKPALARLAPVFRLEPENLLVRSVETDELGSTHVRFEQMKDALRVIGGDLVVHIDAQGTVFAVNGSARDGRALSSVPTLAAEMAEVQALSLFREGTVTAEPAVLRYLFPADGSELRLAWELLVAGEGETLPIRERIYVDAHTGEIADRHALIHTAKNRKIYSANNGTQTPGTLKRTETGAVNSDASVNNAFNHSGTTYDCFKTLFGRDSFDGAGGTLISTVHYDVRYDNAFWDGYQMVYGDGGGYWFRDFSASFDIASHELTHAVTQYTANLAYQSQPGALNEAFSDIFAAVCTWYSQGKTINNNTWLLAEDIFTPGTSGDAMRYMNDPVKDGDSRDHYATRYTGTEDYGGVHTNSGIANLAFKLLVTGGKHPRGRSTNTVPAIGMEKASKIFYRALTHYLTSNSNFAAALAKTRQAAADLYDAATVAAVEEAWAAVGVGTGSTTGGGTTTTGGNALQNGVAVNSLSGAASSERIFTLTVPAGASQLRFQMSGGTGDADLYVRFGAAPTTTTYDARPYLSGNNEAVTPDASTAGTWYVMVRGYSSFSGISLVASFTAPPPPPAGNVLQKGVSVSVSGAANSEKHFTFQVPAGVTTLKVALSGGSGDADLYVRYGAAPTTTTYDGRPFLSGNNETVQKSSPSAGTWYVMVRGYSSFSGASLVATW